MPISLIIDTPGGANFAGYSLRNVGSMHVGGVGLPTVGYVFEVTGNARFSGALHMASTQRLYLDGGGDTYIAEISPNTIYFTTGGTLALILNTGGVQNVSYRSFVPFEDSVLALGSASGHWEHVYALHLTMTGALNHDGATAGFFGTTPVTKPVGVAVSAAGIHAALVTLGLIAA